MQPITPGRPRSTASPSASPRAKNRSAEELARLERPAMFALVGLVCVWVGFRVAMSMYSGPRVSLALAIILGTAAVIALEFAFLPDRARGVLGWLVALLLL